MNGILIAFEDFNIFDGIFGSQFVGLKNFSRMFGDSDFLRALRNKMEAPLTILIVEDEKNTRISLTECIRGFGFAFQKILLAENGKQAVDIFKRERPEIVVTDIRMPGGSGIELAEKIYEIDRHTAIIFLTAYFDLSFLKKAFSVDAVDYILKPVSPDELKMALVKAIENSNSFARKNTELLKGRFFRDLLLERHVFSHKEFHRIRRELQLPEEGLLYGIISIENLNMEQYWTLGNPEYASLDMSPLGRLIRDVLGGFPFVYSFVHHRGRILNVCGVNKEAAENTLYQAAVRLGDRIYEECFEKAVVKVLRLKPGLLQLADNPEEYQEVRLTCQVPVLPGKTNITEKDRHIVECIQQYIACNYADPQLKISDIAEKLCYTDAYLCMVYKKVTGKTINDYLNMYRIEKSRYLMEEGSCRLAEIAVSAGYSNENYYSKVFKKYMGISPKEYQARLYGRDQENL